MKNLFRVAFICLSISMLGGCANKPDAAPNKLNIACVMSGEELKTDSPTVDYMGGKLGFCCKDCIAKWEKLDDAGKKAKYDARKK